MTVLVSGRRRGYSVRRIKHRPLMVCSWERCAVCGLRVTDDQVPAFWISTGRWRSRVGACPECQTIAVFTEGFIPEAS